MQLHLVNLKFKCQVKGRDIIPRGKAKKTDDEFFEISLSSLDKGKKLISVYPEVVDEYNDHSLLKLISITYWVGIFTPIAHRRLKERYGYEVVYVDTMAGSGVTCTKRAGDFLCGSCPAAVEAALKKGFPFDRVIGVEIDAAKAKALKTRLKSLYPDQKISIYNRDILEISPFIKKEIESTSISYIVIDPQALQGMTWEAIGPLLECKGDAMVTWFEDTVWRLKQAALSRGKSSKGDAARLTELLGSQEWKTVQDPADLTTLFINRVLSETKKIEAREIEIIDNFGKHYKMILFVGRCKEAHRIADEWKKHMEKRLGSDKGRNISRLLDVKAGRQTNLRNFS